MNKSQELLMNQNWSYFELVAGQRLTVINFYIAISSVLASVQFAVLQYESFFQVGIFLGILLIFLSFVFWKWDKRSSDMIKISEESIKYFENLIGLPEEDGNPHISKILNREELFTKQEKSKKSILFWKNYYTYATCLRLIFFCFSIVGIFGIIVTIMQIL